MNPRSHIAALRRHLLVLSAASIAAAAMASDPQPPAGFAVPEQFKSPSLSPQEGGSPTTRPTAGSAWWTVFNDPVLNQLEEQAVASNQDLQGAIARVTEARAQASAVASAPSSGTDWPGSWRLRSAMFQKESRFSASLR